MTVQFEDDPSLYDRLLKPVLKTARRSGEARVLALLTKGIANELDLHGVRLWIKLHGKRYTFRRATDTSRSQHASDADGAPGESDLDEQSTYTLSDLVQRNEVWQRLCRAAEEKVLRSTSLSVRDSHLVTSTKLFAALLLPLPLPSITGKPHSVTANINLRMALAGIAMKLLADTDNGRDTAVLTQPALAVQMGWSGKTAGRHLEELERLRLITKPSGGKSAGDRGHSGKGVLGRFRLSELSAQRAESVSRFGKSIEAFVDGTPDRVADLLRTIGHCVWGYSDVFGYGHLAVLIAAAAGVPVDVFNMRKGILDELTDALDREFRDPAYTALHLAEILDRLAADPAYGVTDKTTGERLSPREAADRAMTNYQAEAMVHRVDAEAARTVKGRLTLLLDKYKLPARPIGFGARRSTIEKLQETMWDWAADMHREILEEPTTDEFLDRAPRFLEARVRGVGLGENYARNVVRFILSAPEGADQESYLLEEDLDEEAS